MSSLPKMGTIERVILDKLMSSPNGATYLDFDPALGITEEVMESAIQRLQFGVFESEDGDEAIKFDS